MNPSKAYIDLICRLYGDIYDDREEDSRIGGENWEPRRRAAHKSIRLFQKELKSVHGINLSRSKIQKILITGDRWSTERSREVKELYDHLINEKGMNSQVAVCTIADELNITTITVSINLPYRKVVYSLEEKSKNARRIQKSREKKKPAKRPMSFR